MANTYAQQRAWQQLQDILPPRVHLTPGHLPEERWWTWRGNRVHLDWSVAPAARARILLLHGVGTNGRQMSMLLGRSLQDARIESIAVDLPNYGMTRFGGAARVTYDDWVTLVDDLICDLAARDPLPTFLFGLSAGGMLAYHVAAANRLVEGVAGLSFLDQRMRAVREGTAFNRTLARLGTPLIGLAARTPLAGARIPMRFAGNMRALVNSRAAMRLFLADETSAANWVSLRFLQSYLSFTPEAEPEEFARCPLVFLQPELDRWTPAALSEMFLSRIERVRVHRVTLTNAGHYPIEEPGLTQLHDAIVAMIDRHGEASTSRSVEVGSEVQ